MSNILRSPIVAHGPQPGTYFVEDTIASRLRHQLAEQHAELRDLTAVIAAREDVAPIALREHRTLLSATVRRLERDLTESDAVLNATPEPQRAEAIRRRAADPPTAHRRT